MERIAVVTVEDFDGMLAVSRDGAVDSVYWKVAEWKTAHGAVGYFVSTMVDSDSANFVGDLVTDDGPYETRRQAATAGRNQAHEWFWDNDLAPDQGGA